jgi:hypothetical protein
VSPEVRRLLESIRLAGPNFQANAVRDALNNTEINDQTKEIERLTHDLDVSQKLVISLELTIKTQDITAAHREKYISSQNELIEHLKAEIRRLGGG